MNNPLSVILLAPTRAQHLPLSRVLFMNQLKVKSVLNTLLYFAQSALRLSQNTCCHKTKRSIVARVQRVVELAGHICVELPIQKWTEIHFRVGVH